MKEIDPLPDGPEGREKTSKHKMPRPPGAATNARPRAMYGIILTEENNVPVGLFRRFLFAGGKRREVSGFKRKGSLRTRKLDEDGNRGTLGARVFTA